MRRWGPRGLALVGALALTVAIEGHAEAQSFPGEGGATAVWTPMRRGGNPIVDAARAGAGAFSDVVGDAASPAVFIASDATYLFLRIRVSGDPSSGGLFADDAAWGCLVDTDGDLTSYEFFAGVDGAGATTDQVRYRWNTVRAAGGTSADPSEFQIPGGLFLTSSHARLTPAATSFSGDPDFFVDFAVPWALVRAPGGGAPNVPVGTPMRFACGTRTGAGEADGLNADIADGASPDVALPVPLAPAFSDAYTCDANGCTSFVDTDNDGVPDSVELALGTDPTKADSDGDGIPDAVELTPIGGGPPSKVDTDGDGVIDALDRDSDGDGLDDALEGTRDTDRDGVPDYRDRDDDGDGIDTKDEIADAERARQTSDVDGDGKPNWLDDDADGDGAGDGFEGRGDKDGDGIPDYLDPRDDPPKADGGGPPPEGADASPDGARVAPSEGGVVEGAGLLCDASPGRGRGPHTLTYMFAALALALAARRRRAR